MTLQSTFYMHGLFSVIRWLLIGYNLTQLELQIYLRPHKQKVVGSIHEDDTKLCS